MKKHKSAQIDFYAHEMKARGVSANTVKHRQACISNALSYTVRTDILPGNPATRIELPKNSKIASKNTIILIPPQ